MAEPMRESPLRDSSHRGKVADPCNKISSSSASSGNQGAARGADPASAATPASSNNFDDDNEWDIGIGDLIIDLDADIEKTNESKPGSVNNNNNNMASTGGNNVSAKSGGKLAAGATTPNSAVEHSATVDKGLKMKIKRTKPGTKEAKHEIVKAAAVPEGGTPAAAAAAANAASTNGEAAPAAAANPSAAAAESPAKPGKHNSGGSSGSSSASSASSTTASSGAKRGSSGHRRDKTNRADKHQQLAKTAEVNGLVPAAPNNSPVHSPNPNVVVSGGQSAVLSNSGDGGAAPPPAPPPSPNPPPAPPLVFPGAAAAAAAATASAATPAATPPPKQPPVELLAATAKCASPAKTTEDTSASPPPSKKLKTIPPVTSCTTNGTTDGKVDVSDVCVGTSVGTITEPDCLGPCEPGTSVTLEGIVWNETEGGVLVVNVTWRGKTYVGTLLDCTKHDWAPPRFCDSPTSDLDARTPKGRGKRGRGAASAPANDLSNFTETRSSVHSKLRNGAKGRRGAAGSPAPPSVPPFPRPDTNNKRKGRPSEPDEATAAAGKRSRSGSRGPTSSPPASPVLLECPEPNCSKKYKHINGLKYHQSHAHGAVEEEVDSKDAISLSENDESNAEPPSVPPSPSPEKASPLPKIEVKKETTPEPQAASPGASPEPASDKMAAAALVKGVLRFGDEPTTPIVAAPVALLSKPAAAPIATPPAARPPSAQPPPPVLNVPTPPKPLQPASPGEPKLSDKYKVKIPTPPLQRPPSSSPLKAVQPLPTTPIKLDKEKPKPPPLQASPTPKKKQPRKSPASSPQPDQHNGLAFPTGVAPSSPLALTQPTNEAREEVQSPAYSDISDDGAPVEPEDKAPAKVGDKKVDGGQPPLGPYGMYPYYGQAPYMPVAEKPKEDKDPAKLEKEKKEEFQPQKPVGPGPPPQQAPPYYHPYGYYPYNLDASPFPMSVMADKYLEEKEMKIKEEKLDKEVSIKQQQPLAPPAGKVIKSEMKEKQQQQNENHQILKESIEMKSQMGDKKFYDYPYQMYPRQHEDLRRYYLHPDKRKDLQPQPLDATINKEASSGKSKPSKQASKEDKAEKKELLLEKVKQEGVKPTMETQGPPPPTNAYAYFNPNYMQQPQYSTLPFDPHHPMYRSISPMLVPGPYGATPYLHPPMRYPGPEDLSRGPPPTASTKALDMLQHHASQYAYSSHKIHELQERALKSPTPAGSKNPSSGSNSSNPTPPTSAGPPPPAPAGAGGPGPNAGSGAPGGPPRPSSSGGNSTPGGGAVQASAKNNSGAAPMSDKDPAGAPPPMRSPPPQRHVHTHHHTHVGLGYPILPGQYPTPYGAAVLATPQAAVVSSVFPTAATPK